MRKSMFASIVVLLAVGFLSGCDNKPKYDFSEGDRIGNITKFSYKKTEDTGEDVAKSWEGIATTDDNPNWEFSVDPGDVSVVQACQASQEKHQRVKLHYVQCQPNTDVKERRHRTDYLVKLVTPIAQ